MKDFTIKKYTQLLKALQDRGFFFKSFEHFIQGPRDRTIVLRHDVDKLPDNSLKTAIIEHDLGINGSYYFRSVSESFDDKIIRQIAELGHELGYHYENLSEICKKYKVSSKQKAVFNREPEARSQRTDSGKQKTDVREQMVENGRMEDKKNGKLEEWNGGRKTEEKIIDDIPSWVWEKAIEDFRINLEKFRKLYPVKTICMHGSPLSKFDNRLLWEKYDYRDFGIIDSPREIKYPLC